MPSRTLKTEQDCKDFLSGLKLLGTGGGGSPDAGMEMLSAALADGLNLTWIDVNDLPDDVFSCTAFGSGSISEDTPHDLEGINALGKKLGLVNKNGYRAPEVAVKELEAFTGNKIGAIVPVELGASNTPAPLVSAARMGIALIDGDYSGRAVPQDMQTTYFLKDIKTYPAAVVDYWGNIVILKELANTEMGERIGKMLGVASYGSVFFASMLMSAKDTRETIVPGTLTKSLELGKTIRLARENGNDPIAEAVSYLEGWKLFSGTVTKKDWEDKEGVMVGKTTIKGNGDFSGHVMEIWFLNENHITWLDGNPHVFSPDLIINANPSSGEAYTNTELKAGDEVAVIGSKVYPAFRSEKALKYFGPRFWGFNIEYKTIEDVMAKM